MKKTVVAVIAVALFLMVGAQAFAYPSIYQRGLTILEPGVLPGLALFVGQDGIVYLVDTEGKLANTWESPNANSVLKHPVALEDGHILAQVKSLEPKDVCGDRCTSMVELDFSGNLVWNFINPAYNIHHDYQRLDNGNTLLLCSQNITVPEVSDIELKDDCLLEIDPDGNIVWEWQTADHFDEFEFSDEAKAEIAAIGGDWAHANSIESISADTPHIDPRFAPGNILISYRHLNYVVIVDRVSGEIVWKTDEITVGQHDAQMLTNEFEGAGNILLFDNGGSGGYPLKARNHSRVIEINPEDFSIAWEYNAAMSDLPLYSFYSYFISAAQRLPNGNTFITEGMTGRLFEVTREGEIVWELLAPIVGESRDGTPSTAVYRAKKVPMTWMP